MRLSLPQTELLTRLARHGPVGDEMFVPASEKLGRTLGSLVGRLLIEMRPGSDETRTGALVKLVHCNFNDDLRAGFSLLEDEDVEGEPYTPRPPTKAEAAAMVEEMRTHHCATLRRVLVTEGLMTFGGGPVTVGRKEWRIAPCGTPLFKPGEKECCGCAKGWEHPHNHRADRPAPMAECYIPKGA